LNQKNIPDSTMTILQGADKRKGDPRQGMAELKSKEQRSGCP
jgi:hypothetical protein